MNLFTSNEIEFFCEGINEVEFEIEIPVKDDSIQLGSVEHLQKINPRAFRFLRAE